MKVWVVLRLESEDEHSVVGAFTSAGAAERFIMAHGDAPRTRVTRRERHDGSVFWLLRTDNADNPHFYDRLAEFEITEHEVAD